MAGVSQLDVANGAGVMVTLRPPNETNKTSEHNRGSRLAPPDVRSGAGDFFIHQKHALAYFCPLLPKNLSFPSTFFPANSSYMANANSKGWTDDILIREIRAGGQRRETAWAFIHKTWFGTFLGAVRKSDGKAEEDDVYAVLGQVYGDVQKQVCKPDFELHSAALSTYIAKAVVLAWMRWRGKNGPPPTVEYDPQKHQAGQGNSAEQDYIARETLDRLLAKLGEPCLTILLMVAQEYRMREIAEVIGVAEQTVKNKKSDCHKKLIELAKSL